MAQPTPFDPNVRLPDDSIYVDFDHSYVATTLRGMDDYSLQQGWVERTILRHFNSNFRRRDNRNNLKRRYSVIFLRLQRATPRTRRVRCIENQSIFGIYTRSSFGATASLTLSN